MTARPLYDIPTRHAAGLARITRHFVCIALLTMSGAWGLAQALIVLAGRPPGRLLLLPFLISSFWLFAGSGAMNQALRYVQRERQVSFRRSLVKALLAGGMFMGFQTYALWTLFPAFRASGDASLGVTGFAVAITTLHGLHFLVATLFVSFITARAWGDRYDHEYYWGVTVCAWFWHALGIIWVAILSVYAISFGGVF